MVHKVVYKMVCKIGWDWSYVDEFKWRANDMECIDSPNRTQKKGARRSQ